MYNVGMKMLRRLSLPLCLLLLSAAVCACAPAAQAPAERTLFVMDTYAQLAAYGAGAEDALQACADELYRLEELFSATREASDVSRLNAAGGAPVSVAADTAALLRRARELSALTGGAFDPTVYPLMRLWGFGDDPAVPEDEAIAALLPLVDAERIELGADGTARLPAGMGVDLGGIAKGYAADRLAALLRGAGVESALLTLGGNVYALGEKPDGTAWRIAVRDPADEQAYVGVVEARERAVITSGGYQRYFEQDGTRYHHILDPATGRPADSGLASVTIIAADGTAADALSTALFVMGAERAAAFWREHGGGEDGFAFVLVTDAGEVLYSENAPFTPNGERAQRIVAQPD